MTTWREIIDGCRNGRSEAQSEAYRQSWRHIYPAVYNVLRNREEAEDIMQESMIKGFERLKELKDPEKFPGWQRQISIRAALNRLRQLKKTETLFPEIEIEEPENYTEPIDPTIALRELEQLPEGYRLVVNMHLKEEMTHEEIGNALGISASTSRSQYSRAIAKLKQNLLETYAKQI